MMSSGDKKHIEIEDEGDRGQPLIEIVDDDEHSEIEVEGDQEHCDLYVESDQEHSDTEVENNQKQPLIEDGQEQPLIEIEDNEEHSEVDVEDDQEQPLIEIEDNEEHSEVDVEDDQEQPLIEIEDNEELSEVDVEDDQEHSDLEVDDDEQSDAEVDEEEDEGESNTEVDDDEEEDEGESNTEVEDDQEQSKEEVDKIQEVQLPTRRTINNIKNKEIRQELYRKLKRQERKEKRAAKKKKREEGGNSKPKKAQKTLESLREQDETFLNLLDEEDNIEIQQDIRSCEYSSYFTKSYEPKVLITFSDSPARKTLSFGRELQRVIPNALCRHRKGFTVKDIVSSCNRESYTDILIINENLKQMNGLMVIHLPNGPTANFRLSSVRVSKELKRKYMDITAHRPEVIINNFSTRLGTSVASMLAALFHYDPEFRGRRAVTFHNQRDYIFFKHHRYEFKNNGKKVALHELGPRFTLKLRWLQSGVFDGKTGEYEWIISGRRHEMETSRRRFFL